MLSFTTNHFKFDNDRTYGNNDLPAAPDYFLKGEALYHHASGFFIGPTFDVVGKRWGDFANTYKIDSYGLLGMRTGWSNDHYKVFLEGRNLLDTKYVASPQCYEQRNSNRCDVKRRRAAVFLWRHRNHLLISDRINVRLEQRQSAIRRREHSAASK